MSSVEEIFIDQLKASLDTLVTEGVFKRVYTEPTGIMSAKEFPFVFFEMASDDEYDFKGTHPQTIQVRSRILVTISLKRETVYALRELATLKAKVRHRLALDWHASGCVAQIFTMRTAEDSRVSNLSFKEFATTTLGIDYGGIDTFSEGGINATNS
jgi:hypothetical protein